MIDPLSLSHSIFRAPQIPAPDPAHPQPRFSNCLTNIGLIEPAASGKYITDQMPVWLTTMNLESYMVTERKVRHYVETHTLAARLVSIVNFFTLLLCLLMDVVDMPSRIRTHLNRGHGKFRSGSRAILSMPAFLLLRH